ncbi:FG-GAP repeat domain-containing protein [Streptomyces sp. NPDC056149]|uniref:FG-GAP repeat domain-containing protein n=1 Tax=unclassified Streptomyces TaxID=2593676 RepID=UPI0023818928|nr:VCBS repeat-containing protein [Streptomyces sp. WZ-12]
MTQSAIPRRPRTPGSAGRSRQLVTGAVALALAVTAGPLVAPAVAATPAASATTAPDPALKIAAGSEIVSAGRTGFLSVDAQHTVRWTRYADGTTTKLAQDDRLSSYETTHGTASDIVALGDDPVMGASQKITLRDMATGSSTLIDLTTYGYHYLGTVGSRVVAYERDKGRGTVRAHVLEAAGDKVTDQVITGLPDATREVDLEAGFDGRIVLRYSTMPPGAQDRHLYEFTVADLRHAKVITGPGVIGGYTASIALSNRHLAVAGPSVVDDTKTTLVTMTMNGALWETDLDRVVTPKVGLVGDWALYGNAWRANEGHGSGDPAFRAVPIGGGKGRKVLDHASSLTPTPDGDLLVMGGTTENGEGLYRVSPGTDGAPVAKLLASTGERTGLALVGAQVPNVVELNKGHWKPRWQLSHGNADVTVTLRHTASGASREFELPIDPAKWEDRGPIWVDLDWDGLLGPSYAPNQAAPNGRYTWKLTAKPRNGIGPALDADGTFTVSRPPAPHDYSDNGTPDLLLRGSWGEMKREDTYLDPENGKLKSPDAARIGGGWDTYNQVTAVGDVAGAPHGDLVARDKSGVLWLYLGKGDGNFDGRVKIGGGWGGYTQLTGGGDVNGDGRADLLARDSAGVLWLYKGTGNWKAPFAPRVKVGGGWNAYDQITSVGDVAGAPHGDLVARDKSGVLWLYLGKGDGNFDGRRRIGGGWGAYSQMVGIGDANNDGKADLLVTSSNGDAYVYHGTGNWRAPFAPREKTGISIYPGQTLS